MSKRSTNRQLSSEAEALVAAAMRRQGWEILARNVRHIDYELDLVARKGGTLVVVEVKARRKPHKQASDYRQLLPPRKLAALKRGAEAFLAGLSMELGQNAPMAVRLDLAIVNGQVGKHLAVEYFVNVWED